MNWRSPFHLVSMLRSHVEYLEAKIKREVNVLISLLLEQVPDWPESKSSRLQSYFVCCIHATL